MADFRVEEAKDTSNSHVLTHTIMRQTATFKRKVGDRNKREIQETTVGKLLEKTMENPLELK